MKNAFRTLALTVAVAALAASGCGKDKKKDEGGEKTVAGGTGPGAARATGGGGAKSAFNLFPKESNMVMGVNLNAARGTPLWQKFAPMIQAQAGHELKEFTAACGLDPFTAIDSIVVGGNTENDDSIVVAVKGNLDKGKVVECGKKLAAKEGKDLKVEEDGQIVGFSDGDDMMYVAWLDDGTIVTGGGAENNKDWLKGVLSGGSSITSNKDFMDLVNNTDSNSTIWFAMVPPAGDSPFGGMGGPSPKSMFCSINLGGGLKIDAGLRFEKADDAKMTVDQANQMMGPMKADPTFGKYLAKTQISTAGNDMIVKVDLNQAEFDELLKMVEQQLPMLMMMAGGGM